MLRTAGSHAVHVLMEAILGVVGLVAFVGCVVVWRLAQGPIDITALVQREQHRFPTGGTHISVGHAALAWEGFHDPDSKLDIRFANLTIANGFGALLANFPDGRVTLAVAPLLRGAILPGTIVLDGAAVTLQRGGDGALRLNVGSTAPPENTGSGELLQSLTNPQAIPALAQLRLVRLKHASVILHDATRALQWRADAADILLHRNTNGDVTGDATLDLAVGDAKARVVSHVALQQRGAYVTGSLVTPLSPSAIARAFPALAGLAVIDAPIMAGFSARFDAHMALREATLSVQAGAGLIHAGRGTVALRSATATLRTDGQSASAQDLRVALAPPVGAHAPAPILTGQGQVTRSEHGLHATFGLIVDRLAFADLPAYWPSGIGGGAQPWVTENITGGMAQNAVVNGTIEAAADGSGMRLSGLSGSLEGHDVTLHWLRPVPPIEHAEARLTIDGPDGLHIDVPRGKQGALSLSAGVVRITGVSSRDQFASINLRIDGALADALELLNHPRLKLLSRQPFSLQQPSGDATAKLSVTLPLDVHTTFDDIGINATAKLTDVHLRSVAVGRDLDSANLDLAVDPTQLTMNGDGRLGGVPARLSLLMDFRNGPPSQVTSQVTATGRASAAQMQAAWLPGGIVTAGSIGFDIAYALLRDASATVVLRLDGRDAAVSTPFGWSKPAGPAADAAARLQLSHDRLVGIDAIAASGPGLKLASHVEAQAGKIAALVLDDLQLGRTQARGRIGFPAAAEPRWRVMLRGTTLDVSSYLKQRDSDTESADDAARGPPWQADLAFDEVMLARDETLSPVVLQASSDGLHYTKLDLSAGGHGKPALVRATIRPAGSGRRLAIDATDAGAVLLAAGVADNIRGGRLQLDATFDDVAPHAPLAGTARLDEFRVTDAPAIGRLLKAMTFYGAVDLLRGPGLGFARAVVPFHWQQRVLHLDSARAFSASLGLTAQGDIDLRHRVANVTGTIVPAYFFNQLLGKIPVLGTLFSPEKGGGVFAARYSVRGPLRDPKVGVNPLSALTPGFLRNVFGLL